MTLTTVIGSSGSGKTTFLNDVHKSHKCTYIRQYHNMRPYIIVSKIPNFDPTGLPYWQIYQNEGTSETIKVGGTMAGQFTAGLSGGQRKLLLFELIRQRVAGQKDMLIVLDEPFAGVTDDYVPHIVERLEEMRKVHNILLVTNDHVDTLTKMADNTITVSAIDRTKVKVNNREKVPREKAIAALSVGDDYVYDGDINDDLAFFMGVEVFNNSELFGIFVFTFISFAFFLVTFWNSAEENGALVLIAGGIIAFFCVNPYLLSLVEWRIAMNEEAEALLHSSKGLYKLLKTCLTLLIVFAISWIQYGLTIACVDGLEAIKYWVAMLFDSASLTFTIIALGIYTNMSFQAVEIFGSLPFLLMIFFSTTFSPGSGVAGVKALRYLFARFYFWCMVPGIEDAMEGCPNENVNMVYLVLSALLGTFIFMAVQLGLRLKKQNQKKQQSKMMESMMDDEFAQLQVELYGEKVLKRLLHMNSSLSTSLHRTEKSGSDEEAGQAPHHAEL